MRIGLCLGLLVLLLAAPSSQATFNKPTAFDADYAYMPGLGAGTNLTIVSGAVTAELGSVTGAFGFFDSQGFTLSGLSKVCYRNGAVACSESTFNTLALYVAPGGSFGLCFPNAIGGEFQADHALGLFVDLAADDDLNSLPVDLSLLAPSVNGQATLQSIPTIPASGLSQSSLSSAPCSVTGAVTTLDDTSSIEVRDGATTVTTLTGTNALALFAGQPVASVVRADFFLLPFQSGSSAHFEPADRANAKEGLDLTRIQDLVDRLHLSREGATTQRERVISNQTADNSDLIVTLFNGAIVRIPSGNGTPADITFVRFTAMDVGGQSGALVWQGQAKLAVENGHVDGGKTLVGFSYLQLPWWSYLLWAIAIVVFIVRLVLHPAKTHPVWDKYRWAGWVFGGLAFVVVFFLWDLEVRAMVGASFLAGSSGTFRLILGLLELGLVALVSFAAAVPIRIALRNGFLLGKQGTFMGVAGGLGAIVGFLLGVTYLSSYLDLLLSQVMDKLA